MTKKKNVFSIDNMAKIGIFAAISGVLMIFRFPLPIAPAFMTVDFSDVATLMAGFVLGPLSGAITVILKNLIHLLINGTMTAYVGELSNTIIGIVFVVTSSSIYHRSKTKKRAAIGLISGVLAMTLVATLSNYFVIFPLYGKIMGIDLDGFQSFVPIEAIDSYLDLMVLSIVPFNLVKGFLNAFITFLSYKKVSKIMKGI